MPGRKTARTGLLLLGVAGVMVGLSFAAVPLYDLFCRVTGFAGTTGRAVAAPGAVLSAPVTVRFDASLESGMPWTVRPLQRQMQIAPGEQGLAFYRAHNPASRPVTGVASFNVVPFEAGQYFLKTECFCFTEQVLEPGQTVDMPVSFFVDPELRADEATRSIETITLSYTFFAQEG